MKSRPSFLAVGVWALLGGLLALGGEACSTPTMEEQYHWLDPESKALFLAYYPDLTYEQRRALLDHPESPELLLRSWNIPRRPGADRPRAQLLGRLTIEPKGTTPVTKGTYLDLHAFLNYEDGRKYEVGDEIHWIALPDIFRVDGHVLRFGCVSSEVAVTANFYGEREATMTYNVQKPVQKLDVKVAESSQGYEQSEFVKVQVWATCSDGSVSDVSCQAEWKTDPDLGRMSGCGDLQLVSKAARTEGSAPVTASYAGLTVTKTLSFPNKLYRPN